jgi:hypothetical protein
MPINSRFSRCFDFDTDTDTDFDFNFDLDEWLNLAIGPPAVVAHIRRIISLKD